MTFNFFNKPFSISGNIELSDSTFEFGRLWIGAEHTTIESKYLLDADGLSLITSDNLVLITRR